MNNCKDCLQTPPFTASYNMKCANCLARWCKHAYEQDVSGTVDEIIKFLHNNYLKYKK